MTTLLVRFALAGAIFALILRFSGGWAKLRALPRRVFVHTGLALGAAGYSLQSGLYFAAIGRLDVSTVSLLLYTYPAFVTVGAIALGRAGRRCAPAARWRSRSPASRSFCSPPGRGRSTRPAHCSRSGRRSPTRPTSSCPTA